MSRGALGFWKPTRSNGFPTASDQPSWNDSLYPQLHSARTPPAPLPVLPPAPAPEPKSAPVPAQPPLSSRAFFSSSVSASSWALACAPSTPRPLSTRTCAYPKATASTWRPAAVAPRRLAQLSWKRVGRLAGWLAPKLHKCPLSSIAPVQCAPQLTATQRVHESARTTRGAARGRSSPVPSWPYSLCPQVSTSPTLVTHATCSSPIATARIEWLPSPGWRRGVGHR